MQEKVAIERSKETEIYDTSDTFFQKVSNYVSFIYIDILPSKHNSMYQHSDTITSVRD